MRCASKKAGKTGVRRRSLRFEPLELRCLLDVAGAASLISPLWFEDFSSQLEIKHAGAAGAAAAAEETLPAAGDAQVAQNSLYDWIVQFDTASLTGVNSVAETVSLLAGGGIEFQVVRGLGLVGQVLVRSLDAPLETVQSWLENNVHVTAFELDSLYKIEALPNDPSYSSLWGMTAIDAPSAWNITTGSRNVVVAVIDTGVDYTHPDLAANIWRNPGEIAGNGRDDDGNGFVDDVYGYDFANNDSLPFDDNGHGTHVAGTIAAVANNSLGVAGVNWAVSVMALKFLGSNGTGYLSNAIRAINYATMMRTQYDINVVVSNNSWGGGSYNALMKTAIQEQYNAGILFVAAAGNSSANNDVTPQYPANYDVPNVISVAATDQNNRLASFSCYGATTVDIAAPGVSILSTLPGGSYGYYSGTSMATPHVSGVAALCWAVNPNASVTAVRNALIQGAKPVSALSGKVFSGGLLNAYNAVRTIANQTPQRPAIGSLSVTPNPAVRGQAVTVAAGNLSSPGATVTNFYVWWDANKNGTYDAADTQVAATSNIVNGQATVVINTASFSPGTQRFFAGAKDSLGRWSTHIAFTLEILPADDHGDSPATATAVAAPSLTSGTIGLQGDRDVFKFQAVRGHRYTFSTELDSLYDSTLRLYDRDGITLLAYNDDNGSSLASRIVWTAPVSGTYYLDVRGYGDAYRGDYRLRVQVQNTAPTLAAISPQTMSHRQTTLVVPLQAADADGDPLTFSVQVGTVDPLSMKAYELDQQLKLYQWQGSYWTNLRGANEKYLASETNGLAYPCFILPNGDLYRWGGSIARSTLIAKLSPAYYNNPALLWQAQPPAITPVTGLSATVADGLLTITRSAEQAGDFYVRVTAGDGIATTTQLFRVSVTNAAPTLAAIGPQTMSQEELTLVVPLQAADADGDPLTFSVQVGTVDPLAMKAYELDQQLKLYQWQGSYWTNLRGANEKYLASETNGLAYPCFILPNGELYRWGGSIATSTLIATLSPAYYNNPALLWQAQPPAITPVSSLSAAVADGVLTITRSAEQAGDFYVQVTVSDGSLSASTRFCISASTAASQTNSLAVFQAAAAEEPLPAAFAVVAETTPNVLNNSSPVQWQLGLGGEYVNAAASSQPQTLFSTNKPTDQSNPIEQSTAARGTTVDLSSGLKVGRQDIVRTILRDFGAAWTIERGSVNELALLATRRTIQPRITAKVFEELALELDGFWRYDHLAIDLHVLRP